MPNGDPDWHVTELPKLERFFAPLTDEIRQFALVHNISIERYYHEGPQWSLQFTPPQGGNAAIAIRRLSEDTFVVHMVWFSDDYDAATRSSKHGESPKYRVGEVQLAKVLGQALTEMLAWREGEWSQVVGGYHELWHQYTREQFENMRLAWPKVRAPSNPM